MNSKESLYAVETAAKKFLVQYADIDEEIAKEIYEKTIDDATASMKLLEMLKGEQYTSAYINFTREFEKFVKAVPGWRNSLTSLLSLPQPVSCDPLVLKRQKLVETEVLIELNVRSPVSSTDHGDEVAFWMHLVGHVAMDDINDYLVLRSLKSGNCYLQSAVLLEHYLAGLGSQFTVLAMTDANRFMAVQNHTKEKMIRYLFEDNEGSSIDTFFSLAKINKRHVQEMSMCTAQDLAYMHFSRIAELVKHKPLLVSQFKTYRHFQTKGKYTYDQKDFDSVDSHEDPGWHSMLLIGARHTPQGYYFLLQNFWSGKYFVEVSGDYLYECDARIYYVVPDVCTINETTAGDAHQAQYFECALPAGNDRAYIGEKATSMISIKCAPQGDLKQKELLMFANTALGSSLLSEVE